MYTSTLSLFGKPKTTWIEIMRILDILLYNATPPTPGNSVKKRNKETIIPHGQLTGPWNELMFWSIGADGRAVFRIRFFAERLLDVNLFSGWNWGLMKTAIKASLGQYLSSQRASHSENRLLGLMKSHMAAGSFGELRLASWKILTSAGFGKSVLGYMLTRSLLRSD